jgi:hypothetical protein
LVLCMCGAASAASATDRPLVEELPLGQDACWERHYDAGHLNQHPEQKVASIRLLHMPENWTVNDESFYVSLSFNLRGSVSSQDSFDYRLGGICKPSGLGLHCENDWDAGSWTIARGPDGSLDIRNHGLIANPYGYDAEDIADGAVKMPAKPDDSVWRLYRAADKCEL